MEIVSNKDRIETLLMSTYNGPLNKNNYHESIPRCTLSLGLPRRTSPADFSIRRVQWLNAKVSSCPLRKNIIVYVRIKKGLRGRCQDFGESHAF